MSKNKINMPKKLTKTQVCFLMVTNFMDINLFMVILKLLKIYHKK